MKTSDENQTEDKLEQWGEQMKIEHEFANNVSQLINILQSVNFRRLPKQTIEKYLKKLETVFDVYDKLKAARNDKRRGDVTESMELAVKEDPE